MKYAIAVYPPPNGRDPEDTASIPPRSPSYVGTGGTFVADVAAARRFPDWDAAAAEMSRLTYYIHFLDAFRVFAVP